MSILPSSRPPTPDVEVQRWVLDGYPELRSLRSSLHRALRGDSVPGPFLDGVPEKVAIVATELAANALTHTRPPTVVALRRTHTSFILDVADEDPGMAPKLADARPIGVGGLGLVLARNLALEIGWYVDGDVKHVWARFPIPRRHEPGA